MTESDRLETIEQMIEQKHQTIAEVRQNTQGRQKKITKLTQIIKAGGNELIEKSVPSPEELIELLEAFEVAFEDQQVLMEEQLVQIEKLRQSLKGMIVDADPREVTTIQELAAHLYRIEVAIEDEQTAIEEQLAQIEELKKLLEGGK
jgi:predicted  nucleic acid-binding Zn-ribbon protein